MPNPWVIAHRGASGHAPENTMAAFRRAVELGARFIETDLQITRDGQLVVLHDHTLDRTTNGRGRVIDHTLADLKHLDAGSWFSPEFAGERIPTLQEVLSFANEADLVFYLEVKSEAGWGVEHAVVHALRKAGEAARTVVLSFHASSLATVNRLDPTLLTGLLFEKPFDGIIERAIQVGARQLAPHGDLVTAELVERAHRESLQVVTWTVNEPERMRAALATGVDGIMTDYPDRLRSLLANTQ